MGETKNTQKVTKAELDHKLKLAAPDRQILEDLAVACAKDPSPDNTFQYAFCLSKSTEPSELRYAVSILDGLVKEGYDHQVDCMYGSACALYLLGEYEKSRVSRSCVCAFQTLSWLSACRVCGFVGHMAAHSCVVSSSSYPLFAFYRIDVNKFYDPTRKVDWPRKCT